MAENGGDKEDKFDAFTQEGETLGYISLEQARVLAMRHARDNADFYGPAYANINLVLEVVSEEEGEDYYDIRLSFRPAGRFRGDPGLEQFIIDKTGNIEIRQVLDEPTGLRHPSRIRPRGILIAAVGVVIVGVIAVAAVLISSGGSDSGSSEPGQATGPTANIAPQTLPTNTPITVPTVEPFSPATVRSPVVAPSPVPVNPQTVSLASVTQTLLREVANAAPGFSQDRVDELVSAVLSQPEAIGKTSFTLGEANQLVILARSKAQGTAAVREFTFQLACVERSLRPCELLAGFAERVSQRTNGRVQMPITSFTELGFDGPDALKLIAGGKVLLAEVWGGWVTEELPVADLPSLWGLFPDKETNLKVLDVIREELRRSVADRSNGVVILENYYPGSLFFSKKPLSNPGDFKGLKTRNHRAALGDLLRGLGAEPRFLAFSDVYTALERGIIDAAVTVTPQAALGQRWYEVSKFLVGPVPAIEFSWLIMNREQWNALPQDVQAVIQEEATRHQGESLRLATGDWLKQGIQDNIDNGMEYLVLSPELHAAFRKAAVNTVLPAWVKRVGGPNSPVVKFYNQQVAPIVGIEINPDGSASEIQPRVTFTPQRPSQARRPITGAPETTFLGVGVVGDALRFDVDRFEVHAGSVVLMTLKNASSVNQHNWVLVRRGTKDQVAAAGVEAGPEFGWIPPDDDRVIAQIGLLEPGEGAEIRFVAPAVGRYQFVCTFPGHNITMFGDFNVVR